MSVYKSISLKNQPNSIFVHIPKTGGTTLNAAMRGAYWQSEPDEFYRHILSDKSSNAGDIFDEKLNDKYIGATIFMMVRNPVDRMVSEYYFIKERKEFVNLIKPRPKDFHSYLSNRQTQNYMVGFLKGKKMYDKNGVTEADLADVIKAIDKLDIKVGIFENYNDSLAYFEKKGGLKVPKELSIKRVTFKRPNINQLDDELIQLIESTNKLDVELYNYCLNRFKEKTNGIQGKFKFTGDKYDHVIAYSARACFYEFCIQHKTFISNNFEFFKDLTFHLLNGRKIKDGRLFVETWNLTFLNHFNDYFPSSKLNLKLQHQLPKLDDPIDYADSIGGTIEAHLKENPHERYLGMKLKMELIPVIPTKKNSSRLSRLFGKK